MLTFGIINGTDKYHKYKFRRNLDKNYTEAEQQANTSGPEYTKDEKKYLERFGHYYDDD